MCREMWFCSVRENSVVSMEYDVAAKHGFEPSEYKKFN